MRPCKCGCTKLENRELGLCASCNKARIVGERPVITKERKPLNPISAQRTIALKQRQLAYREVKAEQQYCACCGTTRRLTPSHVLTQKQFPVYAADPRNIVVLCDIDHNIWEHNKAQFKLMFPDVWNQKMQIMQELEPAYYQLFKDKHGL